MRRQGGDSRSRFGKAFVAFGVTYIMRRCDAAGRLVGECVRKSRT